MNHLELKTTVSVLGLHGWAESLPASGSFAAFHQAVLEVFASSGISVTYFAAEGKGYSGELVPTSGSSYKKLRSSNCQGVSVLSLVANPTDSDEPAFDGFATASLSYLEPTQDITLCLAINEGFMPFGGNHYHAAMVRLASVFPWFGGYGFADTVVRRPDLFVVGLDSGKLSATELKRLRAWYLATPQRRMQGLRDVYRWNLVTEGLLSHQLDGRLSLRSFIAENAGRIERLPGDGLYLWCVEEPHLSEAQARLQKAGLIVE